MPKNPSTGLEKHKLDAASYIPTWAGDTKFQVTAMYGNQYIVELVNKTCSCGKWDLSGIPCPVSAIFYRGESVESYVHRCFHIDTYKIVYEPFINPMLGSSMWALTDKPSCYHQYSKVNLVGQIKCH